LTGGVAQVVEHLPSKYEVLSSNPVLQKKKTLKKLDCGRDNLLHKTPMLQKLCLLEAGEKKLRRTMGELGAHGSGTSGSCL
jgi:hypothetical protein